MKRVWWGATALAAVLAVGGASGAVRADESDVDCASLKSIKIGDLGQYDATACSAEQSYERVTDGNVSSRNEVLVAMNRATFIAVRYIEAGRHTYLTIGPVSEFVPGMIDMPMREWGDERELGRFAVAPVEVKITDDSPYLSCFGYVAKWGVVGIAPGYKNALGGLYCAVDTLAPTDQELGEFLDGVEF